MVQILRVPWISRKCQNVDHVFPVGRQEDAGARKRKRKRWKFNNTLWLVIDTGKRSARNFGKISDGKRVLTAREKKAAASCQRWIFYHTSQTTYEPLAFSFLGPSFSLSRVSFLLDQCSTARHLPCRCTLVLLLSFTLPFLLLLSTLRWFRRGWRISRVDSEDR